MKRLFTFLKWLFIITALFVLHAYLTGNTHIFKAFGDTFLKGRLGPTVDTKSTFPTRIVDNAKPQPWQQDSLLGKINLDSKWTDHLEKYKTLGFLVIRNNKVLYEKYWQRYNSSSYTNSWSVAKSIVSILVGVAIKEGKIKSAEQDVSDFLPEYQGTGLKIKHLLTMSSGINFKEQYLNPYGYTAKALYGTDLEKLNRKYRVNNIPGKHFIYLSGNTQVLGFLLKKATGRTLSEYASEKLWQRIGAEHPAYWSLDHEGGNEKAFCCFHTNVRDMARIGQLMLQQGVWNGDTIIPHSYYKAAIALAPTVMMSGKKNHLYGYQWWILNYKGYRIHYARGINGQYIINIPEKNMVIVRLGRNWNSEKKNGHHKEFYDYIDAALSLTE